METLLTYKLYCDIMKRNEYVDVKVLDGDEFGIKSYIFTARAFMKNVNRALVPCDADGELDLDW